MLSGIGPAQHLVDLGIPVISDCAAVGADLQDHYILPMSWQLNPEAFSYNRELSGARLVWNVLRYFATRQGAMTIPAAQTGAFVKSDPGLDQPDIQFHCLPVSGELDSAAADGKPQLSTYPGLTLAPDTSGWPAPIPEPCRRSCTIILRPGLTASFRSRPCG